MCLTGGVWTVLAKGKGNAGDALAQDGAWCKQQALQCRMEPSALSRGRAGSRLACATGAGSARPVVSIRMWSNLFLRLSSLVRMRMRSPRTAGDHKCSRLMSTGVERGECRPDAALPLAIAWPGWQACKWAQRAGMALQTRAMLAVAAPHGRSHQISN